MQDQDCSKTDIATVRAILGIRAHALDLFTGGSAKCTFQLHLYLQDEHTVKKKYGGAESHHLPALPLTIVGHRAIPDSGL